MQLSKENLSYISSETVVKPSAHLFSLPEKVLQFGTGVLLRGLPDYFIDKANRNSIFNGRIVVVKSTGAGDATAFEKQDGLYTLCIRGIEEGRNVEETIICSGISRVLSAKSQWNEVLKCAHNPAINVVISNTTEVGIQLVNESIFQQPPHSFPAKLLHFLYERFKKLGADETAALVVLPTELITDNGKKLHAIVTELAHFNKLEEAFFTWLHKTVHFCNTLVDCIVPGKPDPVLHEQIEKSIGYGDALLTVSEVYRLWAIEGGDEIKKVLRFAEADSRIIITPDIAKYKELKLRLLNGTHTASCGLAFLAGIGTVKEAMENSLVSTFITKLMLNEIAPAIPYALPEKDATDFGRQVLDRFRNPHLQHRWTSISAQYTSKMAMRNIPVLKRYFELYKKVPEMYALGFAAYLLFMKAVKNEKDDYWGESGGKFYPVNDDKAGYYYDLWQQGSAEYVVSMALRNEDLWGTDLSRLDGFEMSVKQNLQCLVQDGAMQTLNGLMQLNSHSTDMGF